ncbi:MAG: CRISPR-associated protein Csx19 [Anaerolineae bacterium]
MGREIEKCTVTRKSVTVKIETDLGDWLVKNAPETAVTLLAFDLDGLIWGKIKSGKLVIAHEYSAPLRADTLQEARLFGKSAELHLWRTGNTVQTQIITDDLNGEGSEYIDETQILWGDHAEPIGGAEFSLMSDGVQGLYHAVPLPKETIPVKENSNYRPLRLQVRHYLTENDDTGRVRIAYSRLVDVTAVAQKETDGS